MSKPLRKKLLTQAFFEKLRTITPKIASHAYLSITLIFSLLFLPIGGISFSQTPGTDIDYSKINFDADALDHKLNLERLERISATMNRKSGFTSESLSEAYSSLSDTYDSGLFNEDRRSFLTKMWNEPKFFVPLIGLYAVEGIGAYAYWRRMHQIEEVWTPRLKGASYLTPALQSASEAFINAEQDFLHALAFQPGELETQLQNFPEMTPEFRERLINTSRSLREGQMASIVAELPGGSTAESVDDAFKKMTSAFENWANEVKTVIPEGEKEIAMTLSEQRGVSASGAKSSELASEIKAPAEDLSSSKGMSEPIASETTSSSSVEGTSRTQRITKKAANALESAKKGAVTAKDAIVKTTRKGAVKAKKGAVIVKDQVVHASEAVSDIVRDKINLHHAVQADSVINTPNLRTYFMAELRELDSLKDVSTATYASASTKSQAGMSRTFTKFSSRLSELENASQDALRFTKHPAHKWGRRTLLFAAVTLPIIISATHYNSVQASNTEGRLSGLANTREEQEQIINGLLNTDGAWLQYQRVYEVWMQNPQLGGRDIPFPLPKPADIDRDDSKFVKEFLPMVIYAQLGSNEEIVKDGDFSAPNLVTPKLFYKNLMTLMFEHSLHTTNNDYLKNMPWEMDASEKSQFKEAPVTVKDLIKSMTDRLVIVSNSGNSVKQ